MFRRLSDLQEASVFSALVVVFALGAAGLIRILDLPSGLRSSALYMMVPAASVLLMLLVHPRRLHQGRLGHPRSAPARSAGPGRRHHRAGAGRPGRHGDRVGNPARRRRGPERHSQHDHRLLRPAGPVHDHLSLGEELGWRGYLLPRLLSLGRSRALLTTGLVWAAWHLPLIFLTPLYHADGNRWLTVPLFVATIVAGSFFFGYPRLWTGSTWPAALAHSAHNGAWGTLAAFTVTTSPVVVNEYLVGDNGVLILIGTALVAWWLGRRLTAKSQLEIGASKPVMSDARR